MRTVDFSGSSPVADSTKATHEYPDLTVDGAALGTWDWNIATGEALFSEQWAAMLGYQLREIKPTFESWQDSIHPDDRQKTLAHLQTHLDGLSPLFQMKHRLRHRRGRWVWVLSHGKVYNRAADGKPLRAAGIQQTITAPKEEERETWTFTVAHEIAQSKEEEERQRTFVERERLQTILEDLNEGVIIAAPDGLLLSMNRAARQMYGFHKTPCSFHDLLESVEAANLEGGKYAEVERPLVRALRGEAFTHCDVDFRNCRTNRHWIGSCSSSPVRSTAGELQMAVLSIRDVTEERRAAAELCHKNYVLHQLSGQLLSVRDQEQKRLARELHDGTVQVLSAAIMNLSVLESSAVIAETELEKRIVRTSLELAQQCVRELRTLSYLLHPPELDELGLVPALRSWVDGFAQRSGIAVDLTVPDHDERLAPELEQTLFRIAQEALGNVRRHSRSATAGVHLKVSEKAAELEIQDAGKGISLADTQNGQVLFGVGLLGMRERTQQLGGSLQVDSRPGYTMIRATLPRNGADG